MKIIKTPFPPEMIQFVRNHYVEAFGEQAPAIYVASLIDNLKAWSFVAMENTAVLGGYSALGKKWSNQILDFAVLPASRGKGVAKALIEHAVDSLGRKIFLDTRVYPSRGDFPNFLVSKGFKKYKPYVPGLGNAEWLAYNIYKNCRSDPWAHRLLKNPMTDMLGFDVRVELRKLTAPQKQIVLYGLEN